MLERNWQMKCKKKPAIKIKLKNDHHASNEKKMSFLTQIYMASYFLTSENIVSYLLSNFVSNSMLFGG